MKQLNLVCIKKLDELPAAGTNRASGTAAEEVGFLQRIMPLHRGALGRGRGIAPGIQHGHAIKRLFFIGRNANGLE